MFLINDIDSNHELKNTLIRLVRNNHFPNSSIILGNEGDDKLRLAYGLAGLLLCTNPSEAGSCGSCKHCSKVRSFSHPDIHFTFPFVGEKNEVCDDFVLDWIKLVKTNPFINVFEWNKVSNKEKKQPNISVAECHQIIRKLNLTPLESKRKVHIVWMAEYLTKEGNRLLKILEEPPLDTYIILVAEDTTKILSTILSRCQLFKVLPMSAAAATQLLVDHYAVNPKLAREQAAMAEGNMMEAINLSSDEETEKNYLFVEWLRLCFAMRRTELLQWAERFAALSRESQKYVLKFGIYFLKEIIKIKYGGAQMKSNLSLDMLDSGRKLIPYLDLASFQELVKILEQEIYYIERNCNARIQLFAISSQVNKIFVKN